MTATRASLRARANGSGVAPKPGDPTFIGPVAVKPGDPTFIGPVTNRPAGPVKINSPIPLYRPYLSPGVPGQEGFTASVGILRPIKNTAAQATYTDESGASINYPATDNRRYSFRFHWNPQSVSYNTPADYTQSARPQIDIGRQLFVNNGSVSFQVMVARQDEVARGTKTAFPMLGSDNFSLLGTMYDIEFLYRAINGDPQNRADHPYATSNFGFLYAYPVNVRFNDVLDFDGIVTSIDVDHQQFSPGMVPTISFVTITMTLINEVAPMGTDITTTATTSQAIADSIGGAIAAAGISPSDIKNALKLVGGARAGSLLGKKLGG